jgi:MinD-like ATPase involved in chromosome partitioning or flagellar assembly
MSQVISIHSFRRGTGKSTLAANIATLLAMRGQRVGIVDMDIHAPTLHFLFALKMDATTHTLNDHLRGRCSIEQAAHDVTFPGLVEGRIYLVPSSTEMSEIAWVLRQDCDVESLSDSLCALDKSLDLDTVVIDTYAGLDEKTLFAMAIASHLIILLRPDQQDYQGTAVMVDIARRLQVPETSLVINEVPRAFDEQTLSTQTAGTFGCSVIAVLPHCAELAALASARIFVRCHSEHPFAVRLEQLVARLPKILQIDREEK